MKEQGELCHVLPQQPTCNALELVQCPQWNKLVVRLRMVLSLDSGERGVKRRTLMRSDMLGAGIAMREETQRRWLLRLWAVGCILLQETHDVGTGDRRLCNSQGCFACLCCDPQIKASCVCV